MKSILASVTGYGNDGPTMEAAIAVATAFSAHLECLHISPDFPTASELTHVGVFARHGLLSEELRKIEAAAVSRTRTAHDAFEASQSRHGLAVNTEPGSTDHASIAWLEKAGQEIADVCTEGRYNDLIVLGREPQHDIADIDRIGSIAVGSGRPVLVASAIRPVVVGRRVAIAWKDTAEAARAVSAAAPFLERAESVVVLTACEDAEQDAYTKQCGEKLVRALKWSGRRAEAVHLPLDEQSASLSLLQETYRRDADMLVMGAYGHSRFREIVFGGVTRDIVAECALPVLLMH
jgi:nucleotide-binding universal stress UspA family protein